MHSSSKQYERVGMLPSTYVASGGVQSIPSMGAPKARDVSPDRPQGSRQIFRMSSDRNAQSPLRQARKVASDTVVSTMPWSLGTHHSPRQGTAAWERPFASEQVAEAIRQEPKSQMPVKDSGTVGNLSATKLEEAQVASAKVASAFTDLQRSLASHQTQQCDLIASITDSLTSKFERRFLALEQAVDGGMKIATSTAATMQELQELFEGTMDRIVDNEHVVATFSQKALLMEHEMTQLKQALIDERTQRQEALVHAAQQTELQLGTLRQLAEVAMKIEAQTSHTSNPRDGDKSGRLSHTLPPTGVALLNRLQSDFCRLEGELGNELMERRQLSKQIQASSVDLKTFKDKFNGLCDQVVCLGREQVAIREEIQRVAAMG